MKYFCTRFLILWLFFSLTLAAVALELQARITREEFAEFYGVLIIEEEFEDLEFDDVFDSCFDPITAKPRRDEIFSVRSPYFKPDILKKKKEEKQQIAEEKPEQNDFKNVYNVELSPKPEPKKNPFKDKLLTANKLIESGSNLDQAGYILSELEPEASEDPVNLSNIAKLYIKKGDNKKAIELLDKARQLDPDDYKLLYTYGVTLYKDNQLDLAEISLFRTIQLKPDFMYAHYNLGNVYYKKEQYKKALDSFKKAMELAPQKADIYFNIAITLEQLGYQDIAAKFYQKTLELNPNDKDAFKAIQRLN